MIKRLYILCFVICLAANLSAQKYGNEWIDYTQKHYRISIPKTGLYRINFTTLTNSGIPLSTINPKNFQLFIKGEEQYITVNGESDNVFNTNDYIEFFAKKNDAGFDSIAYHNILRLPNPYIALFNDTNYAYLTWNNSINNRRASVESDVNFSGYTPSSYVYSEKVEAYSGNYSLGTTFLDVISDPRFVEGEGYGTLINKGQNVQTNFGNLNVFQSSGLPVYMKVSFSGTTMNYVPDIDFDHELKIEYFDNAGNLQILNDTTFYGIKHLVIEKQLSSDKLQNNSFLKVTNVNNSNFATINTSTNLHYIYLKYPQIPDFLNTSEKLFFVDNSSSSVKNYLDLQNVNIGASEVILYDLTNHRYITVVANGNNVKALIPNGSGQKQCFLTTSANINNVTTLTPVNQTGFFVNYKTTNTDPAFVIIYHKNLSASTDEYKQYRQSPAGGSNHVILANIDDLYDQFAYGNIKNPLAIKNFAKFLSDSLPVPPKYLFLIGKSIKNNLARANASNWVNNKIPTMGNPASDNLLTTGIHGSNSTTPFIPIGRISAKNDLEVRQYLNKIVAHEYGLAQMPPEDWHKHILHFSGGADLPQQQAFEAYLKTFGDIIKDTLFGAKIFSFQKNTTAPIQITVSDSVTRLINYGTSLITFFGHGSVGGFDQAIDDPNAYSNKDKYPLFIANSCYSGDIHLPEANSASENFTLIDQKGSIAFIASSSSGVVNPLYYYSYDMYQSLAHETYHKGVGDAIKNTSYKTSNFNNQLQEITSLEMTLEGDPSVKLNAFLKPDYEIKNSYVSLDSHTYTDSIGVTIQIKNNGKAIADTFIVRTERYFPNGDSTTYLHKIKAPSNNTTLKFFVLKDFEKGVGLNNFKVFIDSYNEISELAENNNSTTGTVDIFISGGDILPVYPYKYAIIPKVSQITLKATTADPFAPNMNYKIQLDTNDTFINPINSTIISSIGGVVKWTVNLPFGDSTVYFWRITKDSVLATDNFNWRESSFQVIGNKNGWGQSHFHQFKNDKYRFIKYKKADRSFEFKDDVTAITCRNGFESENLRWDQISYFVNTTLEHVWTCAYNGWSIAVFDSISAKPKPSLQPFPATGAQGFGPAGNCHCDGTRPLYAFDFGSSTANCGITSDWKDKLENFLNSLAPNSKVLAYSQSNHQASTYSSGLINAFAKIGGDVSNLPDTVSSIIFGVKKNIPSAGQAHQIIGANRKSVLLLNDSITTNWTNGYIASEIIGPAQKWNSLHWKIESLEFPSKDSILLKIVGIKANGAIDTISSTFPRDSSDILDLYNYVSASTYPKIQLIVFMRDDQFKTSAQLKKWQVLYDPAPECAINPQLGFANNSSLQAIQEGDNLIVHLPIENIGSVPFTDSLVVSYWIEDANRVTHLLPQKLKANPFIPAQIIIDTIKFDSHKYPGFNYLWIDVNPEANPRHQLEQYHFNNVARVGFNVSKDNMNPLLDVTFDGTHILNGDIISSKPHILVTLKDENKFLVLDDTANFNVFIKYPNQASEKRLYFSNTLQFTPAQLPNNSCKIEWKPEFTEDGKYKLIVQATDRSRNVSGATDYNIQFEILNKQTVTEVLNYPNPFSTATRFVFTLTGSEIPDIFTIQIMTITGKVVKEITKNELGNLHIGRNITEYAWDGKDEFGDKLANGVYLYKVITRHNGKAVEKNATDADSFFKKGIGKLVIMR